MYVKRISYFLILCTVLLVPAIVAASPPEEELQQYLDKLEWSKEELTSYLKFHNLSLEQYETMDELIEVLGTPINDSNILHLLDDYKMTRDDLDDLLNQFGETAEDYTFIEELNTAINFFQRHNKDLIGMTDFLSYVGLTDEEMSLLIDYIGSLDQQTFLSKIEGIDQRIEQFGPIDETAELSEEQQTELLSIFQEVLSAYGLNPSFQSVETAGVMTFQQLVESKSSLNGKNIEVVLYTSQGDELADMALSPDMLESDFVLQTSEQFINVGKLAINMNNVMNGDALPVTASPYPTKILLGIALLLAGILIYIYSNKRTAHS
jgi:processed acidic surface protein